MDGGSAPALPLRARAGPPPHAPPGRPRLAGGGAPEAEAWAPGPWSADRAFLRGVDLFHGRFLWEAHEVWEGIWRQAPEAGPHRPLLQGLVQVAAALLKRHLGDHDAARRLATRAAGWLGEAAQRGGPVVHGVACEVVAAAVLQAVDDGSWPRLRLPGRPPIRVVAGALVEGGRVLAALRRPDAPRGDLWELPGGKVEAGESDAEALVRELVEELGVEVEVGEALGEHVHDYGDVAIRLVALACRVVAGEPAPRDHAALRWLGPDGLDGLAWAPADVPLLPAVRRLLAPAG